MKLESLAQLNKFMKDSELKASYCKSDNEFVEIYSHPTWGVKEISYRRGVSKISSIFAIKIRDLSEKDCVN